MICNRKSSTKIMKVKEFKTYYKLSHNVTSYFKEKLKNRLQEADEKIESLRNTAQAYRHKLSKKDSDIENVKWQQQLHEQKLNVQRSLKESELNMKWEMKLVFAKAGVALRALDKEDYDDYDYKL